MESKVKAFNEPPGASPVPWMSVIVPVYNESAALGAVLVELKSALERVVQGASEVIVVDDASTDNTSLVCTEHLSWVRVIRHETRRGSGAARKTGIAAARGNRIAWIDGDGTYDPLSLLILLNQMGSSEQVVGARSTDHGSLKWPRLAVKHVSFLVASALWGRWIPDLNSGLRVFRRESLLAWADELPDGFSCTSTATLAALNRHQRVAFVPIPYRARACDTPSKFHPITDTFRLWRVIFTQRLNRPFRAR
jgi:glycosyltransferase involved in cell wall biosynthesis